MLTNLVRPHLKSRYPSPIIYIVTFEEDKADRLIKSLQEGQKILEWNMASGRVEFNTKRQLKGGKPGLAEALQDFYDDDLDQQFIVIKDAALALQNNTLAVARLKALARKALQTKNITIFLVSSQEHIPLELEKFISLFEIPLPTGDEIREIIEEYVNAVNSGYPDSYHIKSPPSLINSLTLAFRGLSEHEIRQLLSRAHQQGGNIGNLDLIRSEKEQIIKKSGVLELVPAKETIDDIGGLDHLKTWLKTKAHILERLNEAKEFGVDAPKGVLVVGMPGCGKSLTAKAAAHQFKLPLLRLDVGRLMGRYVGDSEANMRRALALAESVSPCVLWIDELEKAFAGLNSGGGGGGSEVTSRLFGFFLTWMQEKSGAVFVIATANDITALPPELLRRGRFDEIFYVDFPNPEEREKILEIHIKKRRPDDLKRINVARLVTKTEGFCGADLESAVKDAVERAFIEGRNAITENDVSEAIKATRPLSEVMKTRIDDYKARFKEMRIQAASER